MLASALIAFVVSILLLVALYCGIPAANEAHRAAMDVMKEEGKA